MQGESLCKGGGGGGVASAVVVCLFLAGLWFTEAIINGPNFDPKLTLAAQLYKLQRVILRLMLTGPAGLC